ncbi:MAG: hypothetical protein JWM40_1697 [Frankiales bacterium]|nr:hypothetical protein [Frankiales bacterium]
MRPSTDVVRSSVDSGRGPVASVAFAWVAGVGIAAAAATLVVLRLPGTAMQLVVAAVGLGFVLALPVLFRRSYQPRWRLQDYLPCLSLLTVATAPFLTGLFPVFSYFRIGLGLSIGVLLALGWLPRRQVRTTVGVVIVLFAIYQVVPLIESPSPALGLLRMLNWVCFMPLAFIAYDWTAIRRLGFTMITATGALLVGMVLQVSGKLSGTWGGILTEGRTYNPVSSRWLQRYTSFLQNPNDFGLFMACASLIFVTLALSARAGNRLVLTSAAVASLSGLALSSSRGGYLAFVVGFLYLAVAMRFRGLLTTSIIAAAAVVVLITITPRVGTFVKVTGNSLSGIVNGTDTSSEARQQLWQENLALITFQGRGYGGSGSADSGRIDITDSSARSAAKSAQTVDSGWLKLVVEEGVIGLLLLAGIVFLTSRRLWRMTKMVGHTQASVVAVGAVYAAYLFRSLSVDILDINPWNWLVWLLVGLSLSLEHQPPSVVAKPSRGAMGEESSSRPHRGVVVVGSHF